MLAIRHYAEYIGLRCGLVLIDWLPLSVCERVVCLLADLCFFGLFRGRRRIAEDNIRRAGIAREDAEVRRIARASFRHLGLVGVESLEFARVCDKTNWLEHVEVDENSPGYLLLRDVSTPVILSSAHFGNWEIAGQIGNIFRPVVAIARAMNNPLVEKLIKERTSRKGMTIIPKHGAGVTRLVDIIQSGSALTLMVDQHARHRGVTIKFLGQVAQAHTSPARLHLSTKAVLLFGYCVRTGPLRYKLTICEPIRADPAADRRETIRAVVERLHRELEQGIRRHPEQYLWAHRRWRETE
jgi:KDO2-lipid IV(A) lauroyltransferase